MEQQKIERKRIWLYLGITFFITFGFEMLVLWPLAKGTSLQESQMLQTLTGIVMFFPAIGVLFTRLFTKEGMQNAKLYPNFKGHIRYYVMAWFGIVVMTVVGAVAYYVIFPQRFDSSMQDMITQQMEACKQLGVKGVTEEQVRIQLIASLGVGVVLGPVLNAISCFGEEWGWRGYLVPKMKEQMPMPLVLLVSGVIWGLWHAPLTAIGHNYGVGYWGFPFTGILAMCAFSTIAGVILSFVSIRTDSVWPAVIGHGAINSFAAAGMMFHKGTLNPFVGPIPTGIIGGIGFIIVAFIMGWILVKERSDRE